MRTTLLVSAIVAGLIPSATTAPAEAMSTGIIAKFVLDLTVENHYGSPRPPWQPGSKPGWYYGPHPEKNPNIPPLTLDSCKLLAHHPKALHCPHSYPLLLPPSHHLSSPPSSHYPSQHSSHHPPPPPSPTWTLPIYSITLTPPETTLPSRPPAYIPSPPPETSLPSAPTYASNPPSVTTLPSIPTYTVPPPPPPSGGFHPTFHNITSAVQADDYITFGLVEDVADCKAMCDAVEQCSFVNTYHDVHGKDGNHLLSCSLFTLCHGPEDADNRGGQSQPDGSINYIADSNGWCKH